MYEELVDKSDFDPRQNDSIIETEESFLLRNHSRTDATKRNSNPSTQNESFSAADDSKTEQEDDDTPSTLNSTNFVQKTA